jgi:hypothetical protein
MKIALRATIMVLSLGMSSAYAESEVPGPGGPPFTSIPGTRTVTGFGGVAIPDQSGAVARGNVATKNGGTWLFPPRLSGGYNN